MKEGLRLHKKSPVHSLFIRSANHNGVRPSAVLALTWAPGLDKRLNHLPYSRIDYVGSF